MIPSPNHSAGEPDSRFPSGPWKGFFLQPGDRNRHWMELDLTFQDGRIRGDGRDRVGTFLFVGRYDRNEGRCSWTKRYVGKHDIAYSGYNEGKGIWGVWEDPHESHWRGGFRIWPASMGDPYGLTTEEEAPVSVVTEAPVEFGVLQPAGLSES